MKFSHILPLAVLSTAFVVPNEQVFSELAIDDTTHARVSQGSWSEKVISEVKNEYTEAEKIVKDTSDKAKDVFDEAYESVSGAGHFLTDKFEETAFDAKSWVEAASEKAYESFEEHEEPPHHGPPHHGPPHHDDPHHGEPHQPNRTVYQVLSDSKYFSKFTKVVNEYPDLVKTLNGTKANYTIFAPIDSAFPDHPPHHKPTEEQILKFLEYHISPDFYPAGRILLTHTIPTLLKGEHLPSKDAPQRLSINLGLKGLTVNFYSRVVGANDFGTNGVIHAVDSLLLPPPRAFKIIDLLPSEFSTFELALGKTGLIDAYNSTDHPGGTLFAPSNWAFTKLGPKVNAFLFSQYGTKYLKALILYHTVPDNVLYSDAYYKAESTGHTIPKGHFHVELPTALEDHSLSVDVGRYGGLIEIKVNAFSRVSIQDGIAADGVIQVVSDVLIPPKNIGGVKSRVPKWNFWNSEKELTVDDFKARFDPHMGNMVDL